MGELTRRMSELQMLPFNCVTYAEELDSEFTEFSRTYAADFQTYNLDINRLRWAISNFTRVAMDFHERLNKIDKSK